MIHTTELLGASQHIQIMSRSIKDLNELLKKAESIGIEDNQLGSDEYKLMSEELKYLCAENDLPDLSKNIEMVLTYILFPNICP